MTKRQRTYRAFANRFTEICERFGGVANPKDAIGEGLAFDIPTRYGLLKASIHCDCHGNRRPGYYIESIFLRFREYSTGKPWDTLHGFEFNGYSGKWNIMVSGGELEGVRNTVLRNLEHRLEAVAPLPVAAA